MVESMAVSMAVPVPCQLRRCETKSMEILNENALRHAACKGAPVGPKELSDGLNGMSILLRH